MNVISIILVYLFAFIFAPSQYYEAVLFLDCVKVIMKFNENGHGQFVHPGKVVIVFHFIRQFILRPLF